MTSLHTACTSCNQAGSELAFDSLRVDTIVPYNSDSASPAITIRMKYDYAVAGPDTLRSGINNMIVQLTPVMMESSPFAPNDNNVPQMMQQLRQVLADYYLKDMKANASNYENLAEIPWLNYEAYYEGRFMEKIENFLSYELIAYFYTGGAHGSTLCNYKVYDCDRNCPVQLGDVVGEEARPYILELMATKPLPDYDGMTLNQMRKEGYLFEDATLYLPENFYFTQQGITFVFQQYEIAPYALGILSVDLTWEELQPLLPKESVALKLTHPKEEIKF